MFQKAGIVRRGVAFVVDFVFLSLFFFQATYLYSGKWIMGYEEHLWGISDPICTLFLVAIFAYFMLMEAYIGWTIGKRLLGVSVVRESGGRISLASSAIRNLLRVVDGLPAFSILGIVLIVRSPCGQRFGDRIAKTFVVRAVGILGGGAAARG